MSEVARIYDNQKNQPIIKRRKKGYLKLVKGGEKDSLGQAETSFERGAKRAAREWLAKKEQKLQEDREFITKYGPNEWVVWRFKQDWAEYLSQLPREKQQSLSKDEAQKVIDTWIAQMKK